MWTDLDSQAAIEDLLAAFGGFHDSCIREISIASETFVDEHRAMACPGHLDTSALLFFQSQGERLPAIELRCRGVSRVRLRPTPENCDSIISSASLSQEGGHCRLGVRFIGGPLSGPANTGSWFPISAAGDDDLEIIAQAMAWRPLTNALGSQLRYRQPGRSL
jgi:hypothetical protein